MNNDMKLLLEKYDNLFGLFIMDFCIEVGLG